MVEKSYPMVVMALSEKDGGGYVAYAPDLYGCMSDGETPEEAAKNLQDAISEWCAEAERLGRQIPEPGACAKAKRDEFEALIALIAKQQKDFKELKVHLADLDAIKVRLGELERVAAKFASNQDNARGYDFWALMPNSCSSAEDDCRRIATH